ncbi:MAG: endolytic transglycosylase MltG [Nitrospinae bacterium]|nr:endolytic transglycosylase MltG [Nitrospinota bacterium]
MAAFFYNGAVTAPQAGAGEVVVEIKKGDSLKTVTDRLKQAGVISNAFLFDVEARLSRAGSRLRAGEYLFRRDGSIRDVVRTLLEGKCYLRQVTVPEGLSIRQIGESLEKMEITTAAQFRKACADMETLKKFNIPSHTAEGYLFPDTYGFSRDTPATDVAQVMIRRFFTKVKEALPADIAGDPEKLHEIVTMASIVEKETGAGKERKLIAGVFHNRLAMKMPLQSDPTVIYALPDFGGDIRKKDMTFDSPYNTYKYRGLPPGPIASPGLAALEAALRPERTDYLYFVSMNNGEHYFSKNLDDHNKAVRRYQLAGNRSKK